MTVRDLRRNNHYSTAKRVLSVIEKWAYNYNRRNKDNDRNIHIVQLIEDGEEMQPSGNSVLCKYFIRILALSDTLISVIATCF